MPDLACLVLALGLALRPAVAETGGSVLAKGPKVDCNAAFSQVEMTICAQKDWNAADADLNTAYAAAMDRMKSIDAALAVDQTGTAKALRAAQRAWVPFRDAACAAEGYQMHGGTGEQMAIYLCLSRLTRARTDDLRGISAEN